MKPPAQPSLFPDPDTPCARCQGTGRRDTRHTDPLAAWNPTNHPACHACGGTGKQADVPDPSRTGVLS